MENVEVVCSTCGFTLHAEAKPFMSGTQIKVGHCKNCFRDMMKQQFKNGYDKACTDLFFDQDKKEILHG